MRTRLWSSIGLIGIWGLSNSLILLDSPFVLLRYGAALLLLAVLPGWVWLPLFYKPTSQTTIFQWLERLTLSIGLSLSLTIISTMLTIYLPGLFTLTLLLTTLNLLIIFGFLLSLFFPAQHHPVGGHPSQRPILYPQILILALLFLTMILRLPNLGYAEFHEDEAEALMLGVRILQGEDYAIFLHRKGPAQMLLPLAFWLMTDQITETFARFPFALSSSLSVITLSLLGWRLFGCSTGLLAGWLWMLNGYSIAFGRMVQYQALIFFLGPLAIYGLYIAWKENHVRLTVLSAILMATCLLAHFDALLLLPAYFYFTWLILCHPTSEKTTPYRLFLISLLLLITLVATFYVPYIRDPEFTNTTTYLSESRIKPGLLYNNLTLLWRLDTDYSSHFYLPLVVVGILMTIIIRVLSINLLDNRLANEKLSNLKQRLTKRNIALLVSLILSLSTIWLSDIWKFGTVNIAILPWLITGLMLFFGNINPTWRALLILFGAPFIGYGFLVDDPRTHLYIIYPGAVLLASGWLASKSDVSGDALASENLTSLTPFTYSLILLMTIIIGLYHGLIYLQSESRLDDIRVAWDGSWWEVVYDELPDQRQYFGYPKLEGWKAVGALRTQGHFQGDFRSMDEDFIIPIWYNYGQARSCYNTPTHFFVRTSHGETDLPAPYQQVGHIRRENQPRIQIFSDNPSLPVENNIYHLEPLAQLFDTQATPARFIDQAKPSQPLGTQFGPAILLTGYDMPTTRFSPGQTLTINLHWQALQNPADTYRAFIHLTDGTTLWAQHDDVPICRLPTSLWRTGQRGMGQFRLELNPDIPPGHYPLIVGLYQAETLERLTIVAGPGQAGDNFLWIGDIEVVE